MQVSIESSEARFQTTGRVNLQLGDPLVAYIFKGEQRVGSRYKFVNTMQSLVGGTVLSGPEWQSALWVSQRKPDVCVVPGDRSEAWRIPHTLDIPYVLIAHDINTMRTGEPDAAEREMIENAAFVYFPSPDLREYCVGRYNLPASAVVYLKPTAEQFVFAPLPKLPGKHLAYAGGIAPWGAHAGDFGYRCYHWIFRHFMRHDWTCHVYKPPNVKDFIADEYRLIGCVLHEYVPESGLPHELSQYTASLQGYANEDCGATGFAYTQKARQNKLWLGLAAGIPTIGVNPGNGREVYEGSWGVVLDDYDDIPHLELPTITDSMRFAETFESQRDVIAAGLEYVGLNPRIV